MTEILLALAPLLLLVVSLLLGHYPGFDAIVRLAERINPMPRSRDARSQSCPRSPSSRAVSGGLLIAFGFAQRPPPLAL